MTKKADILASTMRARRKSAAEAFIQAAQVEEETVGTPDAAPDAPPAEQTAEARTAAKASAKKKAGAASKQKKRDATPAPSRDAATDEADAEAAKAPKAAGAQAKAENKAERKAAAAEEPTRAAEQKPEAPIPAKDPEPETPPEAQSGRRRSGRPKADARRKKSAQILTPMTETERERVDEFAWQSRQSAAEIVRTALREYWENHKAELDDEVRERLEDE